MTIMTLIPADLHFLTAKGTDYLGGSIREINPMNTKFSMGKLKLSGLVVLNAKSLGNSSLVKWSLANPKTLSPFLPNFKLTCSNFFFSSASMFLYLPSNNILPQNFHTFSGAPLI